jgi:hypothetical protein
MPVIWKYPLETKDRQKVRMPKGAVPLSVQLQHLTPCLWVQVPDPDAATEEVTIRTVATGQPCLDEEIGTYVGTYQSGPFVWHVFVGA